jgi:putative inorganic carbon (HCO3(-)) transporter
MIRLVNGYSHEAATTPAVSSPAGGVAALGRNLYLLFVASWFLHLPARLPVLGTMRIDLILVAVLAALAYINRSKERSAATEIDKMLRLLFAYALLAMPFVEWPGSVIRHGIPEFLKAVVFYYFTVAFIRSRSDLKAFFFVFLACQTFRVLEPLYLHVTQGYWGSIASMSNWEFLNRLSGSPYDVINPNGLAAITCTILLFLYYLAGLSWVTSLAFVALAPVCLYALVLTGSRSGVVALAVIFAAILMKSRHRLLIGVVGVVAIVVAFQFLTPDQQDRYLSLFGSGEKNLETADQRFDGMQADYLVALRRPLLGHGLGTSREANANYGGRDQPSHNLYLELVQELGVIGLAIFLLFLKAILAASVRLKRAYAGAEVAAFPVRLVDALQVWLWMNLIFSLASYGLSDYEWYLMGGLLLVLRRFVAAPLAPELPKATA